MKDDPRKDEWTPEDALGEDAPRAEDPTGSAREKRARPKERVPERCGAAALSAVVPVLVGLVLLLVAIVAVGGLAAAFRGEATPGLALEAAAPIASEVRAGPAMPLFGVAFGLLAAAGSLALLFVLAGALLAAHAARRRDNGLVLSRVLRRIGAGMQETAAALEARATLTRGSSGGGEVTP